ncbi:NACHT domain-containing protein [Streptomyces sp. NPDC057686]|uniref:NACHT domain-containing protein n=1 Tax=Streptomyces sp. NPDC057686 TaxID=3346212 RepID=UPI0036ADB353
MRRVPKWVGLLYVVTVGAFLAWYIAGGHQAEDLGTVVSAFTGLLALPAAVIAVLRAGKSRPAPARREEAADQLAQGVRQQWEAEAQVRRLNDPFPLSVEWVAADADLVESWPHLRELAGYWPGQSPEAASAWAVSHRGLAGEGGEIAKTFERVPTRRLVVLGEPGAGKTMLLIRLVLALLEQRPPGGPVPVLFPLASWDPAQQDLYTWLAQELAQDHPALRAPVPAETPQADTGNLARAMLTQRLILPILDGLDELPQAMRARALYAINQVLPAGQPLVLSSRTAEYRSALTASSGTSVLLNGAAGIRLLPLDPAKAAAYLERDAGGPGSNAAARWKRVTLALGTDTPASEALSTPLGLFMARTIYNPRPDEQITELPDPDELLDEATFPTRPDLDTYLFAAFIYAAYRPHSHHPTRWSEYRAYRTLTFLASHLQNTLGGTPNLAWWQLPKALPTYGRALAVGATVWVIAGLPLLLVGLLGAGFFALSDFGIDLSGPGFGFVTLLDLLLEYGIEDELGLGLAWGFGFGLLYAVAAALVTAAVRDRNPSSGVRWSWRGRSWLTFGLIFGLLFGIPYGIAFGRLGGGLYGFIAGLAVGLPFVFMGGVRSVHPDLDKAVGPDSALTRDRGTFLAITLTVAFTVTLAWGLALVLLGVPVARLALVLAFTLPGAFAHGLATGLLLALARSMWMQFLAARIILTLAGHLPWRLMSFLADAHERRGVLRQAGAVYQFRHIGLQQHLAEEHQP